MTTLRTLMARSRRILFGYDIELLELFYSAQSIAFGLWLANPFVDSFPTAQAYCAMAQIAPEWVWGVIYFLSGVFRGLALLTEHASLRKVTSFTAALLWFFTAITFFVSTPSSPGAGLWLVGAVAAGWSYIRLEDGAK